MAIVYVRDVVIHITARSQSFSEYDIFLKKKVSLCICYIYNFVTSWREMGV